MCAAQEQALRVNEIKYSIDKTSDTPLRRLYVMKRQKVQHTLLVRAQFWLKVNIENATRLGPTYTGCCVRSVTYNAVTSCTHQPQSVQENDEYKILWYFNIQTDKVTQHRRPDTVCINKQKRDCQIIDFAIPGDQNIAIKEQEKADKYQELRIELQKVWNVKVVVIPVVIGALGTMSKKIHQYIKQIDIPAGIISMQKQLS